MMRTMFAEKHETSLYSPINKTIEKLPEWIKDAPQTHSLSIWINPNKPLGDPHYTHLNTLPDLTRNDTVLICGTETLKKIPTKPGHLYIKAQNHIIHNNYINNTRTTHPIPKEQTQNHFPKACISSTNPRLLYDILHQKPSKDYILYRFENVTSRDTLRSLSSPSLLMTDEIFKRIIKNSQSYPYTILRIPSKERIINNDMNNIITLYIRDKTDYFWVTDNTELIRYHCLNNVLYQTRYQHQGRDAISALNTTALHLNTVR